MSNGHIAQISIKINRQDVKQEFIDGLTEVVVDSSLYLPDMFTIQVRDPQLQWVDDNTLDIGKEVEIRTQPAEEQASQPSGQQGLLIKGEITALEPHFSGEGRTTLLVRGYHKSHRLHRGKRTRTFLRVKDSDLARKIATEAGLSADVDVTTVTHEYVLQNNQTNMEFLLARADRIGYQVWASDGKLYFKKGSVSLGQGPQLALGEELISFQPCWAASHQADKMIVHGWDPDTKKAITGEASGGGLTQGGMNSTGGATARKAFGGSAEAVITGQPVSTVDEAKALAIGLSDDISREFVQAEGICRGDPKVKAGTQVTIKNVGNRFSGKYFVTSATHIYNADGYETRFSITGRQPNTISHLLNSGNGRDQSQGLIQGVVPAIVTNLNDPDEVGRVKVKFPWLPKLAGAEIESTWARLAVPMAGQERGFYFLPEVEDEVLVAFEHGDPSYPYIVGGLWNKKDKPPLAKADAVADGKVKQRIIKSTSGHVIILDDTRDAGQIIIRDKTEKNEVVIDSKNNTMTVKVEKDITVEAKGKVNVKSTSDDLTFEGKNMTIKTQQNFNVQATGSCNIKSTQNCTVEGTAGLTIKNAAAQVALSGPTVNINNGALEVM